MTETTDDDAAVLPAHTLLPTTTGEVSLDDTFTTDSKAYSNSPIPLTSTPLTHEQFLFSEADVDVSGCSHERSTTLSLSSPLPSDDFPTHSLSTASGMASK